MINLIFFTREEISGLAHVSLHRVTGLTLPPVDAKYLFINLFGLSEFLKKSSIVSKCELRAFGRIKYSTVGDFME